MIDLVQMTTGIISLCTRLFPLEFRRDYGDEIEAVFHSLANDSIRKSGPLGLVKLCWHELMDLPGNALKEHLASLQKRVLPDRDPGKKSSWRMSGAGALGFGIGLALLILYRWVVDPTNNTIFRNIGLGLFQETVMFGVASGVGWFMIGRALFSASRALRLARSGILFGALGGFLATTFVSNSMKFLYARPGIHFFSGSLIQLIGALIYGACFGASIHCEESYRERSLFLMIYTAACFGMGQFISELAFRLYYMIPISWEWRLAYWGIPLAASAAVEGLVAGALLGWAVSRVKPRKLDQVMARGTEKKPSHSLEGNRLSIDYPVPGK